MTAGFRRGSGAVLWIAVPPGERGYERFPYLLNALSDLGLDPTNIVFEGISRNTYENVLYSRQLVSPEPDQKWLLITSAEHMPRAVGIFRELNWPVIPYPVAYKSDSEYEADGFGASLEKLDGAVREWCGLLAYGILGRTDALFPGP